MSKTFDFQGGGKNIRISDVESAADTVVSTGKSVENFNAKRIKHQQDGRNWTVTIVTIATVAGALGTLGSFALGVF